MAFYCAGNWKMNKDLGSARAFAAELLKESRADERASLVLLPPALLSDAVSTSLRGQDVRWGGKNVHFEASGAFTGENSPTLLAAMGATFCLVGHSERRQLFGETDAVLAQKTHAVQAAGLTPILCVGETKAERELGQTEKVIVGQLREGLRGTNPDQDIWIAYEPVWAIGTGLVASGEQVAEAHQILRRTLKEWSAPKAERIPILYGGSVKADNASALSALKNVDGFLIGGASLKVSDFLQIKRNSQAK